MEIIFAHKIAKRKQICYLQTSACKANLNTDQSCTADKAEEQQRWRQRRRYSAPLFVKVEPFKILKSNKADELSSRFRGLPQMLMTHLGQSLYIWMWKVSAHGSPIADDRSSLKSGCLEVKDIKLRRHPFFTSPSILRPNNTSKHPPK